jgi:glycerol-3-phosphate acyltransferase PlsY
MITILLLGFLLFCIASIPFSLLIPLVFAGKDVRKIGSGNVGATNVYRACGMKYAALCLFLDGIKGYLPIYLITRFYNFSAIAIIFFAACAILGHVYSIFLKGHGGKGVATSLFIMFAMEPICGLLFVISWISVFLITKISALSAILSFFCIAFVKVVLFLVCDPGRVLGFNVNLPSTMFYIVLFVFILFTHRSNIKKILLHKKSNRNQ